MPRAGLGRGAEGRGAEELTAEPCFPLEGGWVGVPPPPLFWGCGAEGWGVWGGVVENSPKNSTEGIR